MRHHAVGSQKTLIALNRDEASSVELNRAQSKLLLE